MATGRSHSSHHKRAFDAWHGYSYRKMLIESHDSLSKSQAIEFLQQASSTESKLSLLDAMKDKVSLSREEIDELVPSSNLSAFDASDISSTGNLSRLSFLTVQQPLSHLLNSMNNGAQTSSTATKRSSLLRGFFGRHPSKKKKAPTVRQPQKVPQEAGNARVISTGDQVRRTVTKTMVVEQADESKQHYDINQQGDARFEGLRYDFQTIRSVSTISPLDVKRSSFVPDRSLSSLFHPISVPSNTNERKESSPSASIAIVAPKISTAPKASFDGNQHKYHVQAPTYHSPKRLSTVEPLAKQHFSPMNNGLCWYKASESLHKDRTARFSRRQDVMKKRSQSSSDSRDTSSSSSSSDESGSTDTTTSASSTSATSSSSESKQRTVQRNKPVNRNQNNTSDLIRIDLNSISSRTYLAHQRCSSSDDSSSQCTSSTNDTHPVRSMKRQRSDSHTLT